MSTSTKRIFQRKNAASDAALHKQGGAYQVDVDAVKDIHILCYLDSNALDDSTNPRETHHLLSHWDSYRSYYFVYMENSHRRYQQLAWATVAQLLVIEYLSHEFGVDVHAHDSSVICCHQVHPLGERGEGGGGFLDVSGV